MVGAKGEPLVGCSDCAPGEGREVVDSWFIARPINAAIANTPPAIIHLDFEPGAGRLLSGCFADNLTACARFIGGGGWCSLRYSVLPAGRRVVARTPRLAAFTGSFLISV